MLELKNKTPVSAELVAGLDKHGMDYVIAVLKAKFKIVPDSQTLVFSDEPVSINKGDEYYDESGQSSIRYGSDVSFVKMSTDVIVNGNAYSPGSKPVNKLDVSIEFGNQGKTCRVIGDRRWYKEGLGWKQSAPDPFTVMPLRYENSFGGSKMEPSGEKILSSFEANPVGKGFIIPGEKGPEDGQLLPNIEDPRALIKDWHDQPAPAGFGFISPDWLPRRLLAGTCDEEWQSNRMPLLPYDFDYRFFNSAHQDLIAKKVLSGGEIFSLKNLTESGSQAFQLPCWDLPVTVTLRGKKSLYAPVLDTVVIEPDENNVFLTWRATIPCNRQFMYVDSVTVGKKRAA